MLPPSKGQIRQLWQITRPKDETFGSFGATDLRQVLQLGLCDFKNPRAVQMADHFSDVKMIKAGHWQIG